MKDAIRYTITIEATVEREEVAGKEWKQLSGNSEEPYGYTPEIRKTVVRNVEVFKQQVENIDMVAVLAAVNGIRIAP